MTTVKRLETVKASYEKSPNELATAISCAPVEKAPAAVSPFSEASLQIAPTPCARISGEAEAVESTYPRSSYTFARFIRAGQRFEVFVVKLEPGYSARAPLPCATPRQRGR